MIPFSILDLAPIAEGSDAGQALRNARSLAQAGERLGYKRFWMGKHHVAEGTSQIRAGTDRFDTLIPVSPAVLVDQVLPVDGQRCDQT